MPPHATSLKLPPELKARIDGIAKATGTTAHAFMVEALEREADRAERYARFLEEALDAERNLDRTGQHYAAADVFRYMDARAAGERPKRPRARSWRR
jgi:predicted transcriptional regulator